MAALPGAVTENKYALHEAARDGRSMLEINPRPPRSRTDFTTAQVVESLLSANPRLASQQDADSRLPLHWACSNNHISVVRLLTAQRSFDPDVQDGSGWTPLMIASSLKDNSGSEIIKLLLETKEASPTITTNTGATALHFAVSKGNLDVCRTLLKHGASARAKDVRGQLPLHRGAAVGNVPIVKLLLESKSPVNATDVDGMTALHHAICEGNGDVAVELLKAGAETDKKDVDGRLAIDCAPDGKVRSFILKAAEREGVDLK